ncbi:MAG TPA: FHA domain-containing protein [Anaerolineaceae bacterium]|nr:FHA domain-containing protein [Anaerolineaceae bacterium]
MRLNLAQIESRLRAFIENSILFIPGVHRQSSLAQQLVDAIQTGLEKASAGGVIPSSYVLAVHPATLSVWQASPEVLDALVQELVAAAHEAGVPFSTPPTLRLSADSTLAVDAVRVTVSLYDSAAGDTAVMPAAPTPAAASAPAQPSAFLIIDGNQTYPLQQPVVNLGRRPDNHIILNDPRVSRNHAQIRAVHGHYVLFDLRSAGGTYVNGLRIDQWALKPGDVISLAGVSIIYGEENTPAESNTTAMSPGQP